MQKFDSCFTGSSKLYNLEAYASDVTSGSSTVLATSEADGPIEPAVCVWLATEQSISQWECKQQAEDEWGICCLVQEFL